MKTKSKSQSKKDKTRLAIARAKAWSEKRKKACKKVAYSDCCNPFVKRENDILIKGCLIRKQESSIDENFGEEYDTWN